MNDSSKSWILVLYFLCNSIISKKKRSFLRPLIFHKSYEIVKRVTFTVTVPYQYCRLTTRALGRIILLRSAFLLAFARIDFFCFRTYIDRNTSTRRSILFTKQIRLLFCSICPANWRDFYVVDVADPPTYVPMVVVTHAQRTKRCHKRALFPKTMT